MKGRIKRFIAGLLTAVLILEGAGGTISYAEESGTQDAPPYSEENPFEMPSETDVRKKVEAEEFILDSSGAAEGNHVRLTDKANASGGKILSWFENGNRILLPFTAEKAGLYKVTVTYISGRGENNPNSLEWSGTNIGSGSKDVWGEADASVFHEEELQIEVTSAGAGELVFTASGKGGPNVDKFEFELMPSEPVSGVTLNRSKLNLAVGRSYTLLATVLPANAEDKTVDFTSSDEAVAAVTEEGVVTGVAEGEATITASAGGHSAECTVTVGGEAQAPEAWGALPSPNQYRYQKEELAAFCHFGPNTYNEIEWGENYGDRAPSDIFRLDRDFEAETMVRTLKEAGFQKLIVTAKHHDGFCIWDSEYTDYTCAEAGYQNGSGDVLADISAACTKYDMDMGLYLSPWDIHDDSYGYYDADGNPLCGSNSEPLNGMTWEQVEELDEKDYNEYYDNQLREILGNDKYGRDGRFVEVWMDGAKGGGATVQNYDFQRWFTTIQGLQGKAAGYDDDCLLFGAQAYTTVRWIGNENGLAAEETWSKSRTDKGANTIDSNSSGGYTKGFYDGNQWTVPEADARITSGWFWGNNKKTPKSVTDLANMYFNSVGHNATLLLNVPPNTEGKVDQAILDRVKEFGDNVRDSFRNNLAAGAQVTASGVRGDGAEAFAPENVLDGDGETYWTLDDGETTGSLTLDLGGTKTFDLVTIEEAIQLGQRISGFTVEYKNGGEDWQLFDQGTTIGAKRICRKKPVKADKVRIQITGSYEVPLISGVGIYKASEGFALGSSVPEDLEVISVSDTDDSDGKGFTYTGWTAESGDRFLEGHSMYAGSGKEATVKFTGSKVWLYGTKDPTHGSADIYVDGTKVDSIDTRTSPRATAQMIYESGDLAPGEHTLRIVNTGTIGLDAAVVLNNGGKGMFQFETNTLEMEEDSVTEVKVKRVGGSSGAASVAYENNPGSAVQMDYDANIGGTLEFADGETEKTIQVTTKRDDRVKGDIDFTIDIINPDGGAVLGFYPTLRVIIHDMDDPQRTEEARTLLEECEELDYDLCTSSEADKNAVKAFAAELAVLLDAETLDVPAIVVKANELKAARAKLQFADAYSEELPFVLPTGTKSKMVEAEMFILDASNAADATKYVRITERAEASGGKEVNWFENGNRIYLPFTAEKAGLYKVTVTYRSGRGQNNPNALEWSGTNISEGSLDVYGGANADANTYHTAELNMDVAKKGAGLLEFTASSKGGPVIDKFEFELVPPVPVSEVTLNRSKLSLAVGRSYTLLATVLPANAEDKTVDFTSSDEAVAAVTEEGVVTGVAEGEATITASAGGHSAECTVTVGGEAQAPEAWGALPSPNQYRYQKEELAAFCHFGPNTYNEIEWGENYGDRAPSDIFRLDRDFEAETMVRTLKEAGFQKLIVTAKHHDGFCIWDSEYTDYTCAEAGYQNGSGDVLADISAACTKYDMDMGLYLSPWDIHDDSYGYYDADGNPLCGSNSEPLNGMTWEQVEELDEKDYNEYYDNQLREILGNDKYGRDGRFVEVWMDGAKGGGATVQNYDFQRWFTTIQGLQGKAAGYDDDCLLFGAQAYTTVRWIGNENGLAAEETWSKSRTDKGANTIDSNSSGGYTKGFYDGNQWTVPEADARITSGWFWGNNKKTPKSVTDLANMYFNSVGHNATLLLNVPPNTEGKVDQAILDRVKEFGDNVRDSFRNNLAAGAQVTASGVRGDGAEAFAPENVLDGDGETYWTLDDGETTGSLTLDLGGTKTFDLVTIEEAIQLGQRISGFTVEYKNGGEDWQLFDQGTTIGAKRICRKKPVKADKVRIQITGSYEVPLISGVGIYKASEGFALGSSVPEDLEVISVSDTDDSDGKGFTYTGWTAESGDRFLEGHSMYAGSGKEATVKFTGSKVWLYGTKDPTHGSADIYVDGTKVDSIDTRTSPRATAQMIYESGDLAPGEHTLRIVNTGTIGLDAAVVLNNGGKGMFQFETNTLEMEEDSVTEVKVKRVGGSSGAASVAYENNPGSAVQMDYDANIGGTLEFADGETEKTIQVTTKRDDRVKGDIDFTIDIINPDGGAVLGFYPTLRVIIHDMDDPERLQEVSDFLAECKAIDYSLYSNSEEEKNTVRNLTTELDNLVKAEEKDMSAIIQKMIELKAAKSLLRTGDPTPPEPAVSVKSVTLSPEELIITDMEEHELTATVLPENATNKNVEFESSKPEVASVNEDGVVIGKKNGETVITVTTEDGGKTATCTVTVAVQELALSELDEIVSNMSQIIEKDEDKYTAESWAEFKKAYDNAIARKEDASVLELKQLQDALEKAQKELEFKDSYQQAIKELDNLIDSVKDIFEAGQGKYSLESWNNFVTAYNKAKNRPESATEDEVKRLLADLEAAKKGLTEDTAKPPVAVPLAAPKGLKVSAVSTGVQITFQKVANASSYEIYRKAGTGAAKKIATVKSLSYLDKTAPKGQRLTYTVIALPSDTKTYKKSAASAGVSITLTDKKTALKAPAQVSVKSTMTGVQITFQKAANASSYEIYRKTGTGAAEKIATITSNTYIDVSAAGGKQLTYTVIALPSNASYTKSAASAGVSLKLPKSVKGLKAKVIGGKVKISFKKVKGAKNYVICRSTKKDGKYKKIATIKGKKTSYVDKKVKKGKTYYYKVITKNKKLYSPSNKIKKIKVKK